LIFFTDEELLWMLFHPHIEPTFLLFWNHSDRIHLCEEIGMRQARHK
jgi:hypothetical protein